VFPLLRPPAAAARIGDLPMHPIPVIPLHLAMGAARKVAALKRVALLLVESEEHLVGIVDERALATSTDETPIAAAMTPLEICLRPAMTAAEARALFAQTRAAVLPVIAGGFVLGAITRGDVEQARP